MSEGLGQRVRSKLATSSNPDLASQRPRATAPRPLQEPHYLGGHTPAATPPQRPHSRSHTTPEATLQEPHHLYHTPGATPPQRPHFRSHTTSEATLQEPHHLRDHTSGATLQEPHHHRGHTPGATPPAHAMFKLMPAAPEPRRQKKGGIKGAILNIYYDPFKWSLVKSFLFFIAGVKTANDFVGFDPMSPNTP
nr:uncharacterized protein SPEM3-like [Procambarus clarkii]